MRRNEFWYLLLVGPSILQAQQMPGRDLLEFPLGSLAEGPATSVSSRDGFRNPASILLPDGARARFSVSSLTTNTEQGVAGQIVALAVAVPQGLTAALSIARAEVTGITRTEHDPRGIGGDLPYNALVVSAVTAGRPAPNVIAGAALRYQTGQLDVTRENALGIDAGVLVEHLGRMDARIGLSSFLWRPGIASGDGAAVSLGGDARVIGPDTLSEVRAAYSYSHSPGLSREHFFSATGRLGRWEARAGVARGVVSSRVSTRARLAVGFRYSDYFIGLAREDTPEGLSPVYHFTFVATVPR